MCVTDHHDMTLTVKVALDPNTINQPTLDYLCTSQSRLLTHHQMKAFENIVGKEENAGNQHFLLFPQCFLPFTKQTLRF